MWPDATETVVLSLPSIIGMNMDLCVSGSVAAAITDVFRKNGINVSNKFVRILKIFNKIYDIKNRGVIYGT